jgi:chemotaxis protein histidine kinase CheA
VPESRSIRVNVDALDTLGALAGDLLVEGGRANLRAREFASLVERLRQRNVVGPLWSYFSMLQRLWPQPLA